MKPREFYELVVKMRQAQKEYFKTRTTANLIKSKQIEAAVDAEIDRVTKILNAQEAVAALKRDDTMGAAAAIVGQFKV